MPNIFILSDPQDSFDETPALKAFSTAKKAAEHLVTIIKGKGLLDSGGEKLKMRDVKKWDGNDSLEVWNEEGQVCFSLQRVEIDSHT